MSVEWTCDNCGHEGNLGRFCIKCGTENPVMRKLYPDPTGKLKEFRKSYWSSGMMIDSTSHEIYSLERQDDGSYVMKYDVLKTMMPTGTVSVYSVDQGQVEKLVNMIDEYKINTWAGLREQTPAAQVFDFSDSSSLFFSASASSLILLTVTKSFSISLVSSGYTIRNISDLLIVETSLPSFLVFVKETLSASISTL